MKMGFGMGYFEQLSMKKLWEHSSYGVQIKLVMTSTFYLYITCEWIAQMVPIKVSHHSFWCSMEGGPAHQRVPTKIGAYEDTYDWILKKTFD